jgi:hypothetical protein
MLEWHELGGYTQSAAGSADRHGCELSIDVSLIVTTTYRYKPPPRKREAAAPPKPPKAR